MVPNVQRMIFLLTYTSAENILLELQLFSRFVVYLLKRLVNDEIVVQDLYLSRRPAGTS